MLSVIILAELDAAPLARTISAIVPGIAEGLVGDGHVLATTTTPQIEAVADAAGCDLHAGSLVDTLKTALSHARGSDVLLLPAGAMPEPGWWLEVADHLRRQAGANDTEAVFSYGSTAAGPFARFAEHFAAVLRQMARRPTPRQGLVANRGQLLSRVENERAFSLRPAGRFTVLRSSAVFAGKA